MIKTINVTQNDINKGQPLEPNSCPVAWALKRHLKPEYYASVVVTSIGIVKNEANWPDETIISPQEMVEFIRAVDDKKPVTPKRFKLDIPDKFLK